VAEPDAYYPNLQRGILLRENRRVREAVPFFQEAISIRPDEPQAYGELARCWIEIPGQGDKAIAAIDRAIALAPAVSFYFGLKGWLLICLHNYDAALVAVEEGLALDPNCLKSLNARANAYTKLGNLQKVEESCHRILELYPDNAPALNLLAQALRNQGRWKESRAVVDQLLAQQPNDAFGQANAGYGALDVGDHLRANEHFLQALRMDPHSDFARKGLVASLQARVWILRLDRFFHRPERNKFVATISVVGIIMVVGGVGIFLDHLLPGVGDWFMGILLGAWLLYSFLLILALFMGNFLLLFDPLGWHALTKQEKTQAYLPATFLAGFTAIFFYAGEWIIALSLLVAVGGFAFSVHFPQIKDRWQLWRQSRNEG